MEDGPNRKPNGEADFVFWGSQISASLQDIQQGLTRAWCLMLASQSGQALMVVDTIERQLDNLPPPLATRYRAASHLTRSAALAFQDDSLAVLAIVLSEGFVKGGAGLSALLTEACGRAEEFEPAERSSAQGSWQPILCGDAITARERDVLRTISQGYSNKRIARTLNISPETVKSHIKRIFCKLSVSTRTEAVSQAVSRGLLVVPSAASQNGKPARCA
jgi:DNA-binding CsgD family transcriptional regulator